MYRGAALSTRGRLDVERQKYAFLHVGGGILINSLNPRHTTTKLGYDKAASNEDGAAEHTHVRNEMLSNLQQHKKVYDRCRG